MFLKLKVLRNSCIYMFRGSQSSNFSTQTISSSLHCDTVLPAQIFKNTEPRSKKISSEGKKFKSNQAFIMEHNFNKGCIQILPLRKKCICISGVAQPRWEGKRHDDPDGWIPFFFSLLSTHSPGSWDQTDRRMLIFSLCLCVCECALWKGSFHSVFRCGFFSYVEGKIRFSTSLGF